MASLTIPNPDVAIGNTENAQVKMNKVWYQKITELFKRTNASTLNGQLTVTATSDTNLRFSYIGSDGTTRVADLTLT